MKLGNLREAAVFMRVLSAGLAVFGYVFLGVRMMNRLVYEGCPVIAAVVVMLCIAGLGLWQAWRMISAGCSNRSDFM